MTRANGSHESDGVTLLLAAIYCSSLNHGMPALLMPVSRLV
jgi:hypothetical protein